MKKILLIIGDAAEVFDTMYPLYRIREDGHQVVVAGPEKRVYHLVQHDKHPDWDITVESPGYKLAADIAFRDIKPEDVEATIYSAMGINWTSVRYDDPFGRGFEYVPFSDQDLYAPIDELWS